MKFNPKYHSHPTARALHRPTRAAMNRLMSAGMPGAAPAAGDAAQVDTAEQVYISSLALLKMLKHGASTQKLAFD